MAYNTTFCCHASVVPTGRCRRRTMHVWRGFRPYRCLRALKSYFG